MGFTVILVSNQPDIAKGRFTSRTFQAIRRKMRTELAQEGAYLDGEYYCLHHPEAKNKRLRVVCECRKPKPGLLLQAARDMSIDLSPSWMIGDNLTDIQAGKNAGTKTMLIGRQKCELCRLMDELDARPDVIVPSLQHAAEYLRKNSGQERGGKDSG